MANIQMNNSCCQTRVDVVKASTEWIITDFSSLPTETGNFLRSPPFFATENDGIQWTLKVYPRGENAECRDFVGVYLTLESSDLPSVETKFRLSILDEMKHQKFIHEGKQVFKADASSWGYHRFASRTMLTSPNSNLLVNDQLKLYCEVFIDIYSSTTEDNNTLNTKNCDVPQWRLSEDLAKLLETGDFSDVALVVAGQEIPAHKCMLVARSAKFAAMFAQPMEENTRSRVDIMDVSPEACQEMLRYMYTGESPGLANHAEDLLALAKMYDLGGLKDLCEEHLTKNISINTALDMYTLADRNNSEQLREATLSYMACHAKEFVESPSWKDLLKCSPVLASEILAGVLDYPLNGPLLKKPRLA